MPKKDHLKTLDVLHHFIVADQEEPTIMYSGAPRTRERSPIVRKFGNLSIQEN